MHLPVGVAVTLRRVQVASGTGDRHPRQSVAECEKQPFAAASVRRCEQVVSRLRRPARRRPDRAIERGCRWRGGNQPPKIGRGDKRRVAQRDQHVRPDRSRRDAAANRRARPRVGIVVHDDASVGRCGERCLFPRPHNDDDIACPGRTTGLNRVREQRPVAPTKKRLASPHPTRGPRREDNCCCHRRSGRGVCRIAHAVALAGAGRCRCGSWIAPARSCSDSPVRP